MALQETNLPPTEWTVPFSGDYRTKTTIKRGPSTDTASAFDGPITESVEERVPMAIEALRYAHDIRKFEIDLYWKRSVYFQTIIGIILAALALTLKTSDGASKWAVDLSVLQALITYLGAILAFAWYAATRGGKYWQRNWETHVDTLENLVTGPLYKTVYNKKSGQNFLHIFKEYPYSTSKLNSFIAAVFVVLFCLIQVVFLLMTDGSWCRFPKLSFVISVLASVVTLLSMHKYAQFEIGKGKDGSDIDFSPSQRKFEIDEKK